eukprot:764834-Hanusia_phi.AAC.4
MPEESKERGETQEMREGSEERGGSERPRRERTEIIRGGGRCQGDQLVQLWTSFAIPRRSSLVKQHRRSCQHSRAPCTIRHCEREGVAFYRGGEAHSQNCKAKRRGTSKALIGWGR